MNPDKYIQEKYNIDVSNTKSPIVIDGLLRKNLYELFHELGYKVGAEIGVRVGNNATVMFKAIPGVRLYLVDPWCRYSDSLSNDSDLFLGQAYMMTRRRVKEFDSTIIRMDSLHASLKFPDNSLDFVYIDANHTYDSCMMDIILWTQKVRKGGIISGHDYRARPSWFVMGNNVILCEGVFESVDDYTKRHAISPVYLTYVPPEDVEQKPSDMNQSWFFVKGDR